MDLALLYNLGQKQHAGIWSQGSAVHLHFAHGKNEAVSLPMYLASLRSSLPLSDYASAGGHDTYQGASKLAGPYLNQVRQRMDTNTEANFPLLFWKNFWIGV